MSHTDLARTTAVETRDLIDGHRERPAVTLESCLCDPNTGATLGPVLESSPAQVERAFDAATKAASCTTWVDSSSAERVALLRKLANGLDARAEDFAVADAEASGVPITVTRAFAGGFGDVVRGAADQLLNTTQRIELRGAVGPVVLYRLAWGPAAVITPFNAPGFVAVKKTAYALAAGCPVVLKPSEWASNSADLLADLLSAVLRDTNLPTGVFQLVHGAGAVGSALAREPRIRALSFTGSQSVGQSIAQSAAMDMKALQLELGSNNPVIVRADADIDATATVLAAACCKLNGQWCESPRTVFVPPALLSPLVDALLDRWREIRIGHSLDVDTEFGPQAHSAQRARVESALHRLQAQGAEILKSSRLPDLPGYFVAPAVVRGAAIADTTGEIFGPVLVLHAVSSDVEALELANSLTAGLAGYVFGADQDAAMQLGARMACGEVKVNTASLLDLTENSTQSFWGSSGIGGHGNAELLSFFLGQRIVGSDDPHFSL